MPTFGWKPAATSKAGQEHINIVDGQTFRQGEGRNVLGDPRVALVWFLNEAARYSIQVRAGEVVTTGTCLIPIPISHVNAVSGDFGDLGAASVRIA